MDNLQRLLKLSERLEVWGGGRGVCVSLKNCEIKDGGFLISTFGTGYTFDEAVDDYRKIISGKRLVFNAYSPNRKEVLVL